jgi:hypothetical protein
MHMKKTSAVLATSLFVFPLVASAQNAQSILNTFASLVNQLIPLALAVALLVFFWGLIQYIWKSPSSEGHQKGVQTMVAGIVGLFFMVSVWGIVSILNRTFGVSSGGSQQPPSVSPR